MSSFNNAVQEINLAYEEWKTFEPLLISHYTNLWNGDFKPLSGKPAYHEDNRTISFSLQIRESNWEAILSHKFETKLMGFFNEHFHPILKISPTVISIPTGNFPRLQISILAIDYASKNPKIHMSMVLGTALPQMDSAIGSKTVTENTLASALPSNIPAGVPVQVVSHMPPVLASFQMYNKTIEYIAFNDYLTATYQQITPAVIGTTAFDFNLKDLLPAKIKTFIGLHDGGLPVFDVCIHLTGSAMMTGAITVGTLFKEKTRNLQNLQILPTTSEMSTGSNQVAYTFTIFPQSQLNEEIVSAFDFSKLFATDFDKYYPQIVGIVSGNIQQGFGQDLAITARLDIKLNPQTVRVVTDISPTAGIALGSSPGTISMTEIIPDTNYLYTDSGYWTDNLMKPQSVDPLDLLINFDAENTDFGGPLTVKSILHGYDVEVTFDVTTPSYTYDDKGVKFNFKQINLKLKSNTDLRPQFVVNGVSKSTPLHHYDSYLPMNYIVGNAFVLIPQTYNGTKQLMTIPSITKIDSYNHVQEISLTIDFDPDNIFVTLDNSLRAQYRTTLILDNVYPALVSVSATTNEVGRTLTLPTGAKTLRAITTDFVVPSVASGTLTPTFPGTIDLYTKFAEYFDPQNRGVRKILTIIENYFSKRIGMIYLDTIQRVICLLRSRNYELCEYLTSEISITSVTEYTSNTSFVVDSSAGWVDRQLSTISEHVAYSKASSIEFGELFSEALPQGAALAGMSVNGQAISNYLINDKNVEYYGESVANQMKIAQLQATTSLENTKLQGQNSINKLLAQAVVDGNSSGAMRFEQYRKDKMPNQYDVQRPDLIENEDGNDDNLSRPSILSNSSSTSGLSGLSSNSSNISSAESALTTLSEL